MYSKYIVLLVLISLASQGLASPLLKKNEEAQDNTHLQEKSYESKTEAFMQLMLKMGTEAKKYLQAYELCEKITDPNATIICREAIQAEFCDTFEKQIAESGSTLCL